MSPNLLSANEIGSRLFLYVPIGVPVFVPINTLPLFCANITLPCVVVRELNEADNPVILVDFILLAVKLVIVEVVIVSLLRLKKLVFKIPTFIVLDERTVFTND